MNKDEAIKILNISNFKEYNHEKLKKQYKQACLKKHPDKGGSHEDFIQLSAAYDFLKNEIDNGKQDDDIFSIFTKIILTHNRTDKEKDIIKKQVFNFVNVISGKILNNIDKDNLIFLKQVMEKYNDYFDKDIYDELINIIKTKTNNIKIYNLNPSVNDLFLDNIFNLNLGKDCSNNTLLVPLWHNELIYDISGETIIVQVTPNLPDYCNIDINNNIHFYFSRKLDSRMLNEDEIIFEINNKNYKVKTDNILIKKTQEFTFKNQGISKITNHDIFDNSNKSDLIISFTLY